MTKFGHQLLTALTFTLSTFFINGQITESEVITMARTGSEAELVAQSSSMMQEGFLYFAEILVDKLLTYQPESSNYHYKKGYLELNIRKNYTSAITHFEKAILDTDPNYDMYSPKESSAPTDAYFHLATAYHLNEDIDKAEEMYLKFKEVTNKKSELLPVTDVRLKQCALAKQHIGNQTDVYLKNIGEAINTEYPEYSPVISLDGSALYFTSRRKWSRDETDQFRDPMINQYPEDVYVSYMDDDRNWSKPERLDFCQPRRNEATIAMVADERTIYLYEDSTGNGDIYYTDFYQAKFQEIEWLSMKNINSEYWETHCMMSHDGNSFYFVSDRPGGYGGRDIYVVKRIDITAWSEPINLGPEINSAHDEDSPFISVDNNTLYFATNGERSMGGFDIMKSSLNTDGSWSAPVNLGYPLNSTNDDLFYTTTVDGRRGYLTSFRKDGKGEKDIYEIHNDYLGVKDLAILKGKIRTVDNKPLPEDLAIDIKLVCIDCDSTKSGRIVYPRLRDGVFMAGLDPCKTYRLDYLTMLDQYYMGNESFTTLCDTAFQEVYKEILIDIDKRMIIIPVKADTVIELPEVEEISFKNIEFIHYFAYNKNKVSVHKGELKDRIRDIEQQLKDGRESITIKIYSSASYVPTKTYGTNEKLTQIRAENIKYDILSHFEGKEKYKGRVNVVIVETIVQGPPYEKDAKNKEKYFPYQFVGFKTE